ncbi:hypothetical protein SY2F82_39990 [Streptomyces sp. Y2F8-2]|nr:hypothetical protein SY2F82_39990 [Streptomyces sp. Y2F8-2]
MLLVPPLPAVEPLPPQAAGSGEREAAPATPAAVRRTARRFISMLMSLRPFIFLDPTGGRADAASSGGLLSGGREESESMRFDVSVTLRPCFRARQRAVQVTFR